MNCWLKLKRHDWSDWMHGLCSGMRTWPDSKLIKPYYVKVCSKCGATRYKKQ